MLVGIEGITGEDVGVEDLAEGPPLGADGEPYDGVVGVVVGGEGVRDVAVGENEVLFLEDLFGGGGGGDDKCGDATKF